MEDGYLNLLIVDDEILEVAVIEKMIDKEKFGIDEIYKAYSMNQAIGILGQYKISILLSDIEMPKGSGHQLVEWIREREMEVIPIFLTSHAEFEYAKKALMMQVMDYLLKPIEKEALEKSLFMAAELVKKQNENKQNERYARYWKKEQNAVKNIEEEEKQTKNTADIVKKIRRYIEENPEKDLDRGTLAAQVYLHPDYLSHIFKKHTGISISNYIIQVRTDLAKELLATTNRNISEIAIQCGYENTAYFTKIFKNAVHMTPKEYRRVKENAEDKI